MAPDFDDAPATLMSPGPPAGLPVSRAPRANTPIAGVPLVAPAGRTTAFGSNPVKVPSMVDRAPRARVTVPVRFRYQSIIDFVDTQSINVSRSGMYVLCDQPLPVGTMVQFEFALADGYVLLKGTAEVVRAVNEGPPPRGMGLRFVEVEEKSRKFIDRIVDVNAEEGKRPSVPMDFASAKAATMAGAGGTNTARAVTFQGNKLSIVLNTATAQYFSYNPLLNIKMGGFVVPADQDVNLGTLYELAITDMAGATLFTGRGKVVAKQDKRLGIRLTDADKETLAKVAAEVNKLAPPK